MGLLSAARLDVDLEDSLQGLTPLGAAAAAGHLDIAQLLLDRGQSPHTLKLANSAANVLIKENKSFDFIPFELGELQYISCIVVVPENQYKGFTWLVSAKPKQW